MEKEILIELLAIVNGEQNVFSEKTGIPEPRISEWIKNKRVPKISTLKKAAESLGYDLSFKLIKIKTVKV